MKKYLTVNITVELAGDLPAEEIKEMIELNGTNIPFNDQIIFHGNHEIGRSRNGRVSVWPKDLSPEATAMTDEQLLGFLAGRFRGVGCQKDAKERRKEIVEQYLIAFQRVKENGGEFPGPEDTLPDEYMPEKWWEGWEDGAKST